MKLVRWSLVLLLLSTVLVACGRRVSQAELMGIPQTAQEEAPEVAEAPETDEEAVAEADDNTEAESETSSEDVVDAEAEAADAEAEVVAQEETVADEIILDIRAADPTNGEMLFNMQTEAGFACSNCHLVDSAQRLVGPGMYGLPQTSTQRVADDVPERYLYNSIVHPNDYLVAEYPENVMPANYIEILTEDQVHDIVAYLMTLDDPSLVTPEPPAEVAEAEPETAETDTEATEAEVETTDAEGEVVEAEPEADGESDAAEAPVVAAEAESDDPATPETIIIVVTATPSVPESDAPVPTPTFDPNAEPDIVVTLVNLGLPSFGERIYASECASCHAVDSSEVIDGNPGLANITGRVLNRGVVAERYLYDVVAQGHAALDVEYSLNDAQLLDITAYLMTLNDN